MPKQEQNYLLADKCTVWVGATIMIVSWSAVRLASQMEMLAELFKKVNVFIQRNLGGSVSTMCSLACKISLVKALSKRVYGELEENSLCRI